jgi:exo-beta-1,3-glucanase (GH17 family)
MVALGAGAARAISIEKLFGGGRIVAYTPRGFVPGAPGRPSPRELRCDAQRLLAAGFRSVTTYGASRALVPVCRFFKRQGFRTVLVGVWDPRDRAELRRAAAVKRCADGYVVGSEGLTDGRYARDELDRAIRELRAATGRPVTTRDALKAYQDDPSLAGAGDWVFPTIHPWRADQRDSQGACGWTIFAYRDLAEHVPAGVPIVIAETGLPTEGGLPTSEHYQRAFFLCIESRQVAFAFFDAFDAPWKDDGGVGAHWGLFRADGTAKLWASQQMQPVLSASRRAGRLLGRVERGPPEGFHVVVYVRGERWEVRPPVVPDRRGAWRVDVPADRPAVVYLARAGWTPPAAVDEPPRADRIQVVARQDLPPM